MQVYCLEKVLQLSSMIEFYLYGNDTNMKPFISESGEVSPDLFYKLVPANELVKKNRENKNGFLEKYASQIRK